LEEKHLTDEFKRFVKFQRKVVNPGGNIGETSLEVPNFSDWNWFQES
jgi:hypothetical protein